MGAREAEVRLYIWSEGGLRQQRNDGGGCSTMCGRSGRVVISGAYVAE